MLFWLSAAIAVPNPAQSSLPSQRRMRQFPCPDRPESKARQRSSRGRAAATPQALRPLRMQVEFSLPGLARRDSGQRPRRRPSRTFRAARRAGFPELPRLGPLLRGKALVILGRSLEARPVLRRLLGSLDNPKNLHGAEARYWLSKGAEDRGANAAAQSTYENVWVHFPTSPWAQKAEERLAGLGVALPSVATEHQQTLTCSSAQAGEAKPRRGRCTALSHAARRGRTSWRSRPRGVCQGPLLGERLRGGHRDLGIARPHELKPNLSRGLLSLRSRDFSYWGLRQGCSGLHRTL